MVLKKIIVLALLILLLMVAACGRKAQPVTQIQFETARQEAVDAEARVVALRTEKSHLDAEMNAKSAKLTVLREMEREQRD